jgi:hypothetical protein
MANADLRAMLRGMEPVLHAEPYGFTVQAQAVPSAFATVAEDEGLTVIAPVSILPAKAHWARISLRLDSDLSAVGLTAAFAAALAAEGVSANVIAGLHHDHIFVPWDRREAALRALQILARDA